MEGAAARSRSFAAAMLLAVVTGALVFQDLGRYPLWDPDEARHAEVAREMAVGVGWRRLFLPTLELEPYREKPAGYYWLVTFAYRLAGVGPGACRAVNATAALITVLALWVYAVGRTGTTGGLGAGLVAATSAGWFGLARYGNLDMTFTALVTLGVLTGLAWIERPAPRRPPVAPYLAAGAACLVKGPLGIVLVFGPLALAAALAPRRPTLREMGVGRGLALVAVTASVFYLPAGVLDPSYLSAFAATNVRRFAASSPHPEPFYYYLVWLPLLLLPWTPFAIPAALEAARDPGRRPLLAWTAFVVGLFSLAHGKVATYILPALPPLALVTGPYLARVVRDGPRDRDARWIALGGWLVAAALVAGAAAALAMPRDYSVSAGSRAILALAALFWAGVLTATLRRGQLGGVPAVIVGTMLTLYPAAVRLMAPAISAVHSQARAATLVASTEPAPIVAFSCHAPSLVFYTRRPLIHTEDHDLVRDLFERDEPVFLLTGRSHFAEIEGLLGPRAYVWYATARRRFYANRPPP